MRKATFPVLTRAGNTVVPIPPTSVYALAPNGARGTTAGRPGAPGPRQPYYDTDLQETVYYSAERTRREDHVGGAR